MFRSRFINSRLTLDNQDIQPIYYRKITVIENKQKCLIWIFRPKITTLLHYSQFLDPLKVWIFAPKLFKIVRLIYQMRHFFKTLRFCNEKLDFPTVFENYLKLYRLNFHAKSKKKKILQYLNFGTFRINSYTNIGAIVN